ncbi:MAG: sulfotransferase [Promethearchaeota archaeon]
MSKSVFVIGIQRSGTTWLANLLCNHSKIVGVQREPFGILESAYFSHVDNFFGNLRRNHNFIQFVETYASSDYFRATGLDKDLLYKNRPKTYSQAFKLIMDTLAEKHNADYWLEKSPAHSLYLRKISIYFPDAKFIRIKRNLYDVITSAIRKTHIKNKLMKKIYILIRLIQYRKYESYIKKFESQTNRLLMLSYESVRKNIENNMNDICKFLGINFEPNMLKTDYKPNTSFESFVNTTERKTVLTNSERKLIKMLNTILKVIPFNIYRIIFYFQVNVRKKGFPRWFWMYYEKDKFQKIIIK